MYFFINKNIEWVEENTKKRVRWLKYLILGGSINCKILKTMTGKDSTSRRGTLLRGKVCSKNGNTIYVQVHTYISEIQVRSVTTQSGAVLLTHTGHHKRVRRQNSIKYLLFNAWRYKQYMKYKDKCCISKNHRESTIL